MTHYTKGTPSPVWAPTDCKLPVSGSISPPSSGYFSPFPHGTGSLSVSKEYLAFEGGPPTFRQDFTCPALLNTSAPTFRTGLSPSMARFSNPVPIVVNSSAGPRSLATTSGVSVDFLSSGYLDVSVLRVRFFNPMNSGQRCLFHCVIDDQVVNNAMSSGFPHSEIHGSTPITGSPWLIAGYHVLHRLLLPRHPPEALLALDPIWKKHDFFQNQEAGASRARIAPGKFDVLDLERQLPKQAADQSDPQATSRVAFSSRFQNNASMHQPRITMTHGGAYQIRTGDLLIANQTLSQLS